MSSDTYLAKRQELLKERHEAVRALNRFHLRELEKLKREIIQKQERLRLTNTADYTHSGDYGQWEYPETTDTYESSLMSISTTRKLPEEVVGTSHIPDYMHLRQRQHGDVSANRSGPAYHRLYDVTQAVLKKDNSK